MDAPGPGVSRRAALATAAGLVTLGLLPRATAAQGIPVGRRGDGDYPYARWIPASAENYTASSRPAAYPVAMVVIHVTQETYDDTIALFRDPAHRVSAHYVLRSADGEITQMVREHDIAWHAGNWDYNTRSIGIEHEGWVDDPRWFTGAVYRASAALARDVCDRYGIPKDRDHVIGHVEVPGTDHTDPGPYWDWDTYMRLVAEPDA